MAFWDVDAPATLAAVEANVFHPFRSLIPEYDYIFTYGGGPPVVRALSAAGRACLSSDLQRARTRTRIIPCLLTVRKQCDLVFVGNRLPDREKRVEDFFLAAAEQAPEFTIRPGRRRVGREGAAAECPLAGACGYERPQRGELFSAHGAEPESRIDGERWLLAADARV